MKKNEAASMQDEAQIRTADRVTFDTKPCNKMETMTKHESTLWPTMSKEDREDERAGGHADRVMSSMTPCNKMENMTKQQSTFLLALNEKDWARRDSGPSFKTYNLICNK